MRAPVPSQWLTSHRLRCNCRGRAFDVAQAMSPPMPSTAAELQIVWRCADQRAAVLKLPVKRR